MKIKAVGAYSAKQPLEPMDITRREPGPNDVKIEIAYCGVCHSDLHQVRSEWAGTVYPCVPGHEIVGRVVAVGDQVEKHAPGDLVGVGCIVDSCKHCEECEDGLENYCDHMTGTYNSPTPDEPGHTLGGYSQQIVVHERYVLRIRHPQEQLAAVAPLLCAGITTYSPLRHWQAGPGKKVGVVGIGILATADWLSRNAVASGKAPLTMKQVLTAMIKAHEIQGCIALENSFNRVGLDHVLLVKVASTAVVAEMLGLTREEILNAVSLAWVDGQSLRTYRHAPNTGTRKSWAAGDATSRAVRLALMAKTGEMGYPSALTAPVWGFYDVSFKGESFRFQRPYGSYVMENVLFKISFPAEFHSQTAVEAAMTLYEQMQAAGKTAADIEKVTIRTHEACIRIIDKKGPLNNPADRDHCIQYMVAIPLLFGRLTAADYEDNVAQDKRIDALREKINCFEDPAFTADYHDPEKRAIANAITLEFTDGTRFEEVVVEYPIGHARRRQDGIPKLVDKFKINLARQFPTRQQQRILEVSLDRTRLEQMPVNEYLDLYVI